MMISGSRSNEPVVPSGRGVMSEPKASASQSEVIRRRVEAAASRKRGAEVAEGTSGAADCVLFREGAQEAALPGRPSFGAGCWAISFD
jgi:hypothetical protein